MNEININSSLAGVKLQTRDNETGNLVFWQSIPCDEEKRYVVEETEARLKLGKPACRTDRKRKKKEE